MWRLSTKVIMILLPLSFCSDTRLIMFKGDHCVKTDFKAVLKEVTKVRCSAVCLQMKLSCVGFCFSKESGVCQLFSLADGSDFLFMLPFPDVNLYFDKSKEGLLVGTELFIFPPTSVKFSGGKALCSSYGGSLYVPQSLTEIAVVKPFLTVPYMWTGLTDANLEGIFVSSYTGIPGLILPWWPGEPNGGTRENCVAMIGGGLLVDLECDSLQPVICLKQIALGDISG
ncbi:tetranectin-like protein [Macrobrachium rosenbergii]|uniref:tetranectin-like protein n=1 Tax=Macrobrachium rosenbergii TaxID=79674 RepID=UPI0034D541A4